MIDRNRVTDRVTLATLRLEVKRAVRPLAVMLIGCAIAAAAGDYIVNSINGGIGSTQTMQFAVADATGVVPGRAEVRFYGIAAGLVNNVSLEHGQAILSVSVATKFGPVYKNAQAEVRPNTPLEDMYLDIVNRGNPSAGPAGPNYVIPVDQTQSPTNLADVLNVFQPDVRTQMYNLIDQLGNGLQDRGADLKQAFIGLMPFLRIAGNVAQQLAFRSQLTKQVIHNTAILSGALSSRSTELHNLVVSGTGTLEALSTAGGQPLRASIAELPSTLHATDGILAAYDKLWPKLDPAIRNLGPVADELPAGLRNIKALATSANPAVVKLRQPVRQLLPLADQLQPFSSDLSGALQAISPQVPDLNTATIDVADCTNQLNEFFNWDASMSKFYDDAGPLTRGNFQFGFYSVPTVKQNTFVNGSQCDGGDPVGAVPTPKYNGPPPAP